MGISRKIHLRSVHLIAAALVLASTLTSCIHDDLTDCFEGIYIRVVPVAQSNSDPNWMGESTFDDIMLYVFDENQVLLEARPTEVLKTEHLFYPRTQKLYVASAANVGDKVRLTEMVPGRTTLSQVEVALKEADRYLDYNCAANPPDLFSGQIELANTDTKGITDLPIHRRVAAVMVRVRGLKEYLRAPDSSDDDFAVVFGAQYRTLNLNGEPAGHTRAAGYPVPYKETGGFRIAPVDDREYYEAPRQVSGDKTDFFRVFSSDEGTPVSVSIYYKDQLVAGTTFTRASDGSLLQVKNDLLNVIEIILGKSSLVIRVKEASWNSVVEVEKDFGNGDGW